jgi:hypothetical protein
VRAFRVSGGRGEVGHDLRLCRAFCYDVYCDVHLLAWDINNSAHLRRRIDLPRSRDDAFGLAWYPLANRDMQLSAVVQTAVREGSQFTNFCDSP